MYRFGGEMSSLWEEWEVPAEVDGAEKQPVLLHYLLITSLHCSIWWKFLALPFQAAVKTMNSSGCFYNQSYPLELHFNLLFPDVRELQAINSQHFPQQYTWAQALERNRMPDFQCLLAHFSRYVFPWLTPVKLLSQLLYQRQPC